jgi:hypothetical protein
MLEHWNTGIMGAPDGRNGRNWVRFAHFVLRRPGARRPTAGLSPIHNPKSEIRNRDTASGPRFGQLALFCGGPLHVQFAITPFPSSTCPSCRCGGIGFVSHNRPASGPFWRSGPANWFRFARWVHDRLLLPASNFALQTSPVYTRPPITRRVAGICAKKWISPPSEIAVSPCPDANKENFGAGPFWVLDCCTNKSIVGVSAGQGLPPNSEYTRDYSVTDRRLLATGYLLACHLSLVTCGCRQRLAFSALQPPPGTR